MKRTQYLKITTAALISSIFAALFILTLCVFYSLELQYLKTESKTLLEAATTSKKAQLTAWITDEVQDAGVIVKDKAFVELVGKFLQNKVDDSALKAALVQIKTEHLYADLVLLTVTGDFLLSTNPALSFNDAIDRAILVNALQTDSCFVSDIYRSTINQQDYIDLVAVVRDAAEVPLCGLIFKIDPKKSLDILLTDWQMTPYNGMIALIRQQSDEHWVMYHPENLTISDTVCWLPVNARFNDRLTQAAKIQLTSKPYSLMPQDGQLVHLFSLPYSPWSVVLTLSDGKRKADLQQTVWTTGLIGLLFIVVCFLCVYFIIHKRHHDLLSNMHGKETELKDFSTRFSMTMDVLNEAIVVAGIDGKIRYMNLMAESLCGWKLNEAKGNPLESVLPLMQEETGLPLMSISNWFSGERAFHQGVKALLINQSGRKIAVSCSIAPYTATDASQNGLIVVLVDETTKRKLEQNAMQKEKRFRNLFEDAPDASILADKDGSIKLVNVLASNLFGYKSEEFLTMRIENLILETSENHAAFRASFFENPKKCSMGMDKRIQGRRKDGSVFNAIVSLSPIKDDEGLLVMAVIRDISEMVDKEVLLQVHGSIINHMKEGMLLMGMADKRILFTNPQVNRMFGYTDDELMGKEVRELLAEDDPITKYFDQEYTTDAMEQVNVERIIRCQSKQGSYFFVSAHIYSFLNDFLGRVWIAVVQDVTDQEKAENQAYLSDLRFNELMNVMDDVVWTFSPDGKTLLSVNPAFERIYGVSVDVLYQNPAMWLDMVHPQDKQRVSDLSSRLMVDGKINCVYRIIRNDGKQLWLADSKSVIRDNKGKVVQLGGIVRDVTKMVHFENALLEAKSQAEDNERLKTAFLANITHELRTPLNSIIGFSQLIGEGVQDPAEITHYATIITESGKRLLDLLSNLMDLSKLESGVVTPEIREFVVVDFLDGLYEEFVSYMRPEILLLEMILPDKADQVTLRSDVVKLRKILINLLNNAFKFTAKGTVQLGFTLQPEAVIFFVKDTGMGIDPGVRSHIFEPFFQSDSSTSRMFEGAGVGLAISKGYANLLGGDLWLDTGWQHGSLFYLSVPREPLQAYTMSQGDTTQQ